MFEKVVFGMLELIVVMLQRLYATSSILNFRPTNFPTYCNIRPTTAVGWLHIFFFSPTYTGVIEFYHVLHGARVDLEGSDIPSFGKSDVHFNCFRSDVHFL